MKLFRTKVFEWRPDKWPCVEVYEKTVVYFWIFPIKSYLKKIK